VRPMHLRYDGRCRLCGTALPAGTFAVYERSLRTVRCVECESPAEAAALLAPVVANVPNAPAVADDELRLRAPASAVIAETLRVQAATPPRSASARFFGRTPLSPESQPWFLGAIGELEIGRVLDRLGDGWLVIHAVPVGTAGSDIDHLVIGPSGVFTINAKYHEGMKVWVGSKRVLVNGQRTEHLRNAVYEGKRVSALLTRATGLPVGAKPIVAIVAARSITVRERPTDVVVLSSTQLLRWLQRRAHLLTDEQSKQLMAAALNPATWGNPALPPADLASFATLRESVTSARRRRRSWALVAVLSPFAIFASALLGLFR
jgi:hypothetical protein